MNETNITIDLLNVYIKYKALASPGNDAHFIVYLIERVCIAEKWNDDMCSSIEKLKELIGRPR